jgi:CxxC-x17-CxxC domain-containing protein
MRNFRGSSRADTGRGFSKRRDNDYDRPVLHQATCDSCGSKCEVPFKPTSGKPIFCSSCFEKEQNDSLRKFERDSISRNSKGRESRGRDSRGRDSNKRSFGDRDNIMHSAVCDSCGDDCEVPFKPTKGKPIYCDNCFGNSKENDTEQLKKEFVLINKKLDQILKVLGSEIADGAYTVEFEDDDEDSGFDRKPRKRILRKRDRK